jgi:hypothetical protein
MSRVWAWLVWWFVGRRRALQAWDNYKIVEGNLRRIEDAELALPANQRSIRALEAARRDRESAYGQWVAEIKKRP